MWFKFHSSHIFKVTYIVRPCNVNRNATMKYNGFFSKSWLNHGCMWVC